MKVKRFGKLLVFSIITTLMASMLSISAFATGNANFIIPKKAVVEKNDFSVSIKITADKNIGFITGMITYDDSIAEFKSSDNASGEGGVLNLKGFPDEESKEMAFNLKFTALKSGTCRINLTNCFITSPDGVQIGSPTAYADITVSGQASGEQNPSPDPDTSEASSNSDSELPAGYLKSLKVSEGVLKPNFSYDIYDYHVDVENSVDKCEIEGETTSLTDQIWYTGSEFLAVGDNVRTIKVTNADGVSHVYTITITRAATASVADSDTASIQNTTSETGTVSDSEIEESINAIPAINENNPDGMERYRKILTPALIIILIALIIALVVIIVWLRKKKSEYKADKPSSKRSKRK